MTDRENGDTRMNGGVTSGTSNRAATEIIRIIGDLEVVPVLVRQVIMSLLLPVIKTGAEMIIGDPKLRRRLLISGITMLPLPLTITTFPPTTKM